MSKDPILLFDGECQLCNATVNFVRRKDRNKRIKLLAQQSKEAQPYLKEAQQKFGDFDSVILLTNNNILIESEAVLTLLTYLPSPWKYFAFLRHIPQSWRDAGYRMVARLRHRWSKNHSCRID